MKRKGSTNAYKMYVGLMLYFFLKQFHALPTDGIQLTSAHVLRI